MLYEVITAFNKGVGKLYIEDVHFDDQAEAYVFTISVITSYSIHYTKLYESQSASFTSTVGFGNPVIRSARTLSRSLRPTASVTSS